MHMTIEVEEEGVENDEKEELDRTNYSATILIRMISTPMKSSFIALIHWNANTWDIMCVSVCVCEFIRILYGCAKILLQYLRI